MLPIQSFHKVRHLPRFFWLLVQLVDNLCEPKIILLDRLVRALYTMSILLTSVRKRVAGDIGRTEPIRKSLIGLERAVVLDLGIILTNCSLAEVHFRKKKLIFLVNQSSQSPSIPTNLHIHPG